MEASCEMQVASYLVSLYKHTRSRRRGRNMKQSHEPTTYNDDSSISLKLKFNKRYPWRLQASTDRYITIQVGTLLATDRTTGLARQATLASTQSKFFISAAEQNTITMESVARVKLDMHMSLISREVVVVGPWYTVCCMGPYQQAQFMI